MSSTDNKQLAQAIGRTIAKRRMQCDLTQDVVAEKLGIGYEAVSRIERGVVIPNITRLAELAGIFGCSTADLLQEVSPLPADQAGRIAQLLAPLSAEDRELIVALVERLALRLGQA